MQKVVGMILTIIVTSVLLAGCYSKSCNQPIPAEPYKDEMRPGAG